MLITYHPRGGFLALLTFAVAAVIATVLTVAMAATVLVVGVAIAGAALLVRTLRRAACRHTVSPPARWAQDTIEAAVLESRDGLVRPTRPRSNQSI